METKATWYTPAWRQNCLNALNETLNGSPHAKHDAINFLLVTGQWDRDKTTYEVAESRYNGNLNPQKQIYFKLSEIWALMKHLGRHQLFLAMAEDLGYEVRRKPSEERLQELLEKFHTSNEQHGQLMVELKTLMEGTTTPLRIHSAFVDGNGSFDAGEGC